MGVEKSGGRKKVGVKKVGVKKSGGKKKKKTSKTPILQTATNQPNHHYYRTQKIEKIAEKNIVRNNLKKIKFDIFFFFTENVFQPFLRGPKIFKKKY